MARLVSNRPSARKSFTPRACSRFSPYDDEHHRFAIAAIPGLEDQPPMAAGTDHVAFTYANLGDLLYTYARLKREGIEP